MRPLADRMRPKKIAQIRGQEHLTGKEGVIRKAVENDQIPSLIFWGPPGTGKTTLASIIAEETGRTLITLNAISSGVKDIREAINGASEKSLFNSKPPILFIDEIHRFHKGQQDTLLHAVEKGVIILIGATTENPSFEVNSALLSRCQVYTLQELSREVLQEIYKNSLQHDRILSQKEIDVKEDRLLLRYSGGDARRLLNLLELIVNNQEEEKIIIDDSTVQQVVKHSPALYDKAGEMHYDLISAYIKSVRGSDPDAAVYYLARMIKGGEEVTFISRRLMILAAEDIGLADPQAIILANSVAAAVERIGWPESRILLSELTIYLAKAPKSNSAYMAINKAEAAVNEHGDLPVPLHLRNAPTKLMKELGYGKNYLYAHNYKDAKTDQVHLPEKIKELKFYKPTDRDIP